MALIHNQSEECVKTELDLFTVPYTQTSIEKSTFVEIPPVSALRDAGPLEFFISACGEDYIDLNDTYLYMRARITNPDGTDLAQAADVGFVNYPGCTLFSQVDIMLGDRLITQSSNTYPYRGIIECLINYGKDTLDTQFSSGLFCKDTADHMNVASIAGDNEGLAERGRYTVNSRTVELIAPIHSDLFFQEKLLLNGIDISLKFIRSKDEFALMTAQNNQYAVKIVSASLFVKKVAVAPAVRLAHSRALQHTNAKYAIDRVALKTFSIPAGTRVCNQENLYMGQIPKFVIMGFVDHEAYSGSYNRNPFCFQHYDTEFISLYADGQSHPAKPFQPLFQRGQYVREYFQLVQTTGRHLKDRSLAISRNDFGNGYTLFCFNLEPDDGRAGNVSLIKSGNVRLEVRFRVPLQRTVNLVCYAVYDSVIEISNKRQVLLDYY
ncbi:uncharacterized protein F54H12.2-like [Epinephelus lanceolatus]